MRAEEAEKKRAKGKKGNGRASARGSMDSYHYGMTVKQPENQNGSSDGAEKENAGGSRKKKILLTVAILIIVIAAGITFYLSRTDEQANITEDYGREDDYHGDLRNEELKVYFLDVGQGDCILVSAGEHHLLIDAGGEDYGTRVWKFLQDKGITELDYCIGSHFDADHIGGMDVVLQKFKCKQVMLPDYVKDTRAYDNLFNVIESKRLKVVSPEPGEKYTLGGAEFTIISPSTGTHEEENDYSIGIILRNGDNAFVFTGDATMQSEEQMMNLDINLKADVLKAAHHGSSYSTGSDFLEAVSPKYIVVSCGKDNDYGHPHRSFLKRAEEAGCQILRTDERGNVTFISDGRNIELRYDR